MDKTTVPDNRQGKRNNNQLVVHWVLATAAKGLIEMKKQSDSNMHCRRRWQCHVAQCNGLQQQR